MEPQSATEVHYIAVPRTHHGCAGCSTVVAAGEHSNTLNRLTAVHRLGSQASVLPEVLSLHPGSTPGLGSWVETLGAEDEHWTSCNMLSKWSGSLHAGWVVPPLFRSPNNDQGDVVLKEGRTCRRNTAAGGHRPRGAC